VCHSSQEKYRKKLAENLFHDVEVLQTPKILAFHKKPPVPSPGAAAENPLTESFASPPSRIRKIPQVSSIVCRRHVSLIFRTRTEMYNMHRLVFYQIQLFKEYHNVLWKNLLQTTNVQIS